MPWEQLQLLIPQRIIQWQRKNRVSPQTKSRVEPEIHQVMVWVRSNNLTNRSQINEMVHKTSQWEQTATTRSATNQTVPPKNILNPRTKSTLQPEIISTSQKKQKKKHPKNVEWWWLPLQKTMGHQKRSKWATTKNADNEEDLRITNWSLRRRRRRRRDKISGDDGEITSSPQWKNHFLSRQLL